MRTRQADSIQLGVYQGKVALTFNFAGEKAEVLLLPIHVAKNLGDQVLALHHEMEALALSLQATPAAAPLPIVEPPKDTLSIEESARLELWPPADDPPKEDADEDTEAR